MSVDLETLRLGSTIGCNFRLGARCSGTRDGLTRLDGHVVDLRRLDVETDLVATGLLEAVVDVSCERNALSVRQLAACAQHTESFALVVVPGAAGVSAVTVVGGHEASDPANLRARVVLVHGVTDLELEVRFGQNLAFVHSGRASRTLDFHLRLGRSNRRDLRRRQRKVAVALSRPVRHLGLEAVLIVRLLDDGDIRHRRVVLVGVPVRLSAELAVDELAEHLALMELGRVENTAGLVGLGVGHADMIEGASCGAVTVTSRDHHFFAARAPAWEAKRAARLDLAGRAGVVRVVACTADDVTVAQRLDAVFEFDQFDVRVLLIESKKCRGGLLVRSVDHHEELSVSARPVADGAHLLDVFGDLG